MSTLAVARNQLLPDEIQSATKTVRESYRDAAPHRPMRSRYLAFYLLLLATGCLAGATAQHLSLVSAQSGDFWRAILSTLSVLTGFMITTLSFTGKAEAAKSLTLEQLRAFTLKSNHLLFSQLTTLCVHIGGIVLVGLIFLLAEHAPVAAQMLCTLVFGLFVCSLFRSLLVPIQIIELHRFTHAALLAEKRDEAAKAAGEL